MTGSATSTREIRRREDLDVRQLHDSDRVAAQRELAWASPHPASSSVVPASVNTPSPARPVASIASERPSTARRRRFDPFDDEPPARHGDAAVRERGAAVDASARRRCRRRRGRRRPRPRPARAPATSSARKPTSGHSTRTVPFDERVARAHVGDLGVDVGAAAGRSAHRCREREPPVRQRHAGLHEIELASRTPARRRTGRCARVSPPVSATAPRGSPMRSNSEPDS